MGLQYYLTKIIYSFILLPGIVIIIFFASALFARKFRKFFLLSATLFYLLSTQAVGNLLIAPLEAPFNQPPQKIDADAVVVLGSGHYMGSSNLPLTPIATKRMLYALMLAKEHTIPILFSGLSLETKAARETIAEINRALDIKIKIEQSKKYTRTYTIFFEDKAHNTKENATRTHAFFTKNGIHSPKIYLVTSASHMKRALGFFQKEGINTTPAATDFRSSHEFCYCFFFPTREGLDLSATALYEYLALFKQYISQAL